MKLTAAKIREAAEWVEKNGLHPQACGAPIRDFAKAMGVDPATIWRWMRLQRVQEAIDQARARFASTTVRKVENALIKAALGVDVELTKEEGRAIDEVTREYDPVTGKLIRETKTKKMVTVKAVRERRYFPPDVRAAQFVLTNMAGDRWSVKPEVAIGTAVGSVQITVGTPEAAAGLRHALETGAKPRDPDDQEQQ